MSDKECGHADDQLCLCVAHIESFTVDDVIFEIINANVAHQH